MHSAGKPGCIGFTRSYTRLLSLAVLVILGIYPGTEPSCIGCTRVPGVYPGTKPGCIGFTRLYSGVLNLAVLVFLGYDLPGY